MRWRMRSDMIGLVHSLRDEGLTYVMNYIISIQDGHPLPEVCCTDTHMLQSITHRVVCVLCRARGGLDHLDGG